MTAIPPPGRHGDDAARIAGALGIDPADMLDLACTLNPVAPRAASIVARHLGAVGTYPDPTAATATLASDMGVEPSLLLLTNGGAEAIALVAAEFPRGWVDEPDFSLYSRHLSSIEHGAPRWRSNPHNPSGRLAADDEEAFVWDEAFYPMATGSWTRGDHLRGAIVLGSLTKLLACPGLRLGYVIAPDAETIERLGGRQPRWSVNGLAAAALPELLDKVDVAGTAKRIGDLRVDLTAMLRGHGLEVDASDAPFVLVRGVDDLRARLAPERVAVRDCASFGMPGVHRIAVPGEEGLQRLDAALARALGGVARIPAAEVRLTGALMVCGTSSDAGKSQIVAGLCRALARRGTRVAPFKGQNMSLNSFATPSGHEIGRAQAMQAMAAGIEPEVAMNPVLLKPTGERRSQVVVMGRPTGEAGAVDYQATKAALRPQVLQALADLRARFDVVICEGAGSPAEINLLDNDIVNLGLAAAAGVRAIIVGDIERGGVFASLYGTIELLPQELRRCVKGFVINKLRGDPSLLTPGIEELEQRTGVPCLGVIPWIDGLVLDAEDSLALARLGSRGGVGNETVTNAIDVAVVRLPRISNFTDLDALSLEPAVGLRLVTDPAELGDPDLILIPGSKTTVLDLQWLHDSGLAAAIRRAADEPEGPVVLGVCAGYQMLGASIEDSVESGAGVVEGLGLLGGKTVFGDEKVTRLRRGTSLGHPVTGYEIRHGTPASPKGTAWIDLDGPGPEQQPEPEGERRPDGRVYGTSLHGLFEADAFRSAFLAEVAGRRGKQFSPDGISFEAARQAQFDRVADLVEEHVDLDRLWRIVQSAPAPAHRKDPA